MIWIRPEVVIMTSNKSLDELLEDKCSCYNDMNKIALKNRIIEVKMNAYDQDGNFVVKMFEYNANFF